MNIMILVGSADVKSHSLGLGKAIEEKLKELGAETTLINLVEYGLPLYNRSIERENSHDDITRRFLDTSLEMDAFVWVTPIYHNSYSAMLKNALDWHHSTKFPGKVLGLASNGGNRSPQAVDQLMLVARSQHMLVSTTRVCTDESDYDSDLNLSDEDMKIRVKNFADELLTLTNKVLSEN
ncbi:NAD(P)H-dependent oxidoreductase [Candidatus Saccharibacteria bacterium]|nr:NAD(P)H-dependent oxidoreductase [Candidatus Saccharibacteria bacterium]